MKSRYKICYKSYKHNFKDVCVSVEAYNILDAISTFYGDLEHRKDCFRVLSVIFENLVDSGEVF